MSTFRPPLPRSQREAVVTWTGHRGTGGRVHDDVGEPEPGSDRNGSANGDDQSDGNNRAAILDFLAVPTAAPTAQPTAAPTPSDVLTTTLQEVLDDWRVRTGAPAAVIGLRLADGRTAIAASGQADEVAGLPLTVDDRFRVGSITKTFVAALILQLAAEGQLDIDARLSRYLPAAPHSEQITVRQLLDHTSGLADFALQPRYVISMLTAPSRRWTAEETIAVIADEALEFEPGSRWEYSNTNYVVLGQLAEQVGGASVAQLLRERIYQPLGLDSTFLEEEEDGPPMRVAGHVDLDNDGEADSVRDIPYTAIVTSGAAAGGISANALDVLDFASGLFDGRLLDEDSLDEMLTVEPPSTDYGLGIASRTLAGREAWGHGGAIPGFSALFVRANDGTIGVGMANQTDLEMAEVVRSAARAASDLP